MTKKIRRLLALAACCTVLTGCTAQSDSGAAATEAPTSAPVKAVQEQVDPAKKTTGHGFYFDTVVTLTLYGAPSGLMDEIWAACERYENLLSKTIAASDVSRINAANGQTVTVDPETWDILRRAKEISKASGGAFSVTIAPITAMWDFTGMTFNRVPTDEARLAALPLVDDQRITLGDDGVSVTLPAGMQIDLGGIAKGYIADKVAELVRGRCTCAIISLGGNVYTVGQKPDGSQVSVGVQDPWSGSQMPLAVVYTQDMSVVTSGTYERGFSFCGKRYHHILDPKTGLPAESDLVSATFIMTSSMDADALATACIVLGSDKALELAAQQGVDAVFIRADGSTVATEGFGEKYRYTLLSELY